MGPPNVVLIVVDTLRADRLEPYGYPLPTSPGLDAFAEDATLFEACFAHSGHTSPSTATVLTGADPTHTRFRVQGGVLDPELETLPEQMKRGGYATLGVSYNPAISTRHGFSKGFDVFDEGTTDPTWREFPDIGQMLETTKTWLDRRHKTAPVFIYWQPMNTHAPYHVPDEKQATLLGRPPAAPPVPVNETFSQILQGQLELSSIPPQLKASMNEYYDTAVRHTADTIGDFFEYLKSRDLYDHSLIVLTSDHGEELLERGAPTHGYNLYQSTLHVPLFIKMPLHEEPRRVPDWVSLADVAPTVLDVAGLPPLPAATGTSLVPVMDGSDDARQRIAERSLWLESEFTKRYDGTGVIRGRKKTIVSFFRFPVFPEVEVFDLGNDMAERDNLMTSGSDAGIQELLEERERIMNASPYAPAPRLTDLRREEKARLKALGYLEDE